MLDLTINACQAADTDLDRSEIDELFTYPGGTTTLARIYGGRLPPAMDRYAGTSRAEVSDA